MISRALLLLIVSGLPVLADPPRPLVEAAPDLFTSVPNDLQRVAGALSLRLRANTEGYLEKVDLTPVTSLSARDISEGNVPNATNAAGFFLAAAAEAYEYSDDSRLKSVMDRFATSLIKALQGIDQFESSQPGRSLKQPTLMFRGAALYGLLAYYRVTADEEALATSRRTTDQLIHDLMSNTSSYSGEGAGEFLGSVVELYRSTGDRRYLDFARHVVKTRPVPSGYPNNYAEQLDSLLFLSGIADLYRVTGDATYLNRVGAAWQDTKENHLTIAGAPIALPASSGTPQAAKSDGCLTFAWIRLSLDLLSIRGDAKYAQELENSVSNQLLASQDPRTGHIDPRLPEDGTKKPALKLDRCSAAVALGIATIPEMVWGRYGTGVAINSYRPGRATIRLRRRATVQIYSEGNYPESGNMVLHIEPTHDVRFPLRLRVPAWTTDFNVDVGSQHLRGKPGEYLVIDREWKPRDLVKINVKLDSAQITDAGHPDRVAIRRGPQLLVLTVARDSELKESASAAPASGTVAVDSSNGEAAGSYLINGEQDGKPQPLTLMPFSEASSYRLWLKTPRPISQR